MRLILILLFALCAAPVLADQPLVKLQTGDDNRGWEAVGKLILGDRGFCTGVLIAPDLVLTAAHCLFDKETGARLNPAKIKFLAGWRNGRAEAYRGARQAVAHPDYVYGGADTLNRVAYDVAVVQLDQPILSTSVKPFAVAGSPAKGDVVAVVSYAQDRADTPSLQQSCSVLDKQPSVLVMTCDVDFGSSGAPVFRMINGVRKVVSVISAKADVESKPVALGSALEIPLAQLMAELDAGNPSKGAMDNVRVLSGGGGGGAKFVKPTATTP